MEGDSWAKYKFSVDRDTLKTPIDCYNSKEKELATLAEHCAI